MIGAGIVTAHKNKTALEAGIWPGIGYAKTCGNSPADTWGRSTGSEAAAAGCAKCAWRKTPQASPQKEVTKYALFKKCGSSARKERFEEVKMREAQRRELLDCVGSLHQAHEEIRGALEKKEYRLAQKMLGECQEFAVSIGNAIEKWEGEGHAAIAILESYCEILFRIYNDLESGGGNAVKIGRILIKEGRKIENSIRNEIQTRKEVVFLPYKASMWDSLESVWQAAGEDPACDAYVIPIPYYDRKPDGSLGQMHYEFDQYPEYVPVMRYDEYNFEVRQPDMIFIHNPYDDCNYVTSVHPFFYSKNLKRFTSNLVYIPYFILWDVDPDNPEAVKGIEHFCMTPGVWNADQVIVQSENMKKAYVKVLSAAMEDQGLGRAYWEAKIQGLGSPKIDKVLSTRKEALAIPMEWRRIIEKADGSWKKIIFYNTSVTALLKNGEKYLQKMQDVMKFFYEKREDAALLWRPHPLMKATIESMRPQLWDEYQKIVEQYQAEGWGIYDDTADMDRALALSDAYYGDGSSIVFLCREKGMPVMIQNVETLL